MVRALPPHPDLAYCVAWYWSVDAAPDAPVDLWVDVYVDARADLVFNFGAPYRRTCLGEATEELVASNVDAQRTKPIAIEQRGAVSIAGVRFHAGGVAPFTDTTLADVTDHVVPVDRVFGAEAIDLEWALRAAAGDPEAQRRLFDAFLLGRRRRDRGRTTFARLLAQLVAPGTDTTVASAAAACGYYDQAHLVRDVRRFAGGPPTTFRGYFPPEAPRAFAPNVVRFVHDGDARVP